MTFCQLKFDIIDLLIKERLVKERSADEYYHCEPYMVKWSLANDIGLVFVIVY